MIRLPRITRVFGFDADTKTFAASIPQRFRHGEGTLIHQGRNELRILEYRGKEYVVKSFHRPNLLNRFVYGILRPSKAKRSYRNARLLLDIGVGTPTPVGYINVRRGLLFDRSYYVSEVSVCPYRYEELFSGRIRNDEAVLRAVARTTATLHRHGLAHKDYGRGNILFQDKPADICIDIVDLNRMFRGKIGMKAG
jgi:tRNA A-37 threonylcarbamoyl transferase component Bud32